MKKLFVFTLLAMMAVVPMVAQEKVYDPDRDPNEQIDMALEEARSTGRYVVCQVGGNWCPWCLRFAEFITKDEAIASVVKENFVYVHINRDKEHKNLDAMKRLGNPARFGFPVLVVLDEEGHVLHLQNSAYLEKDKGYDQKKVLEFFQNWTPKAVTTLK